MESDPNSSNITIHTDWQLADQKKHISKNPLDFGLSQEEIIDIFENMTQEEKDQIFPQHTGYEAHGYKELLNGQFIERVTFWNCPPDCPACAKEKKEK